MTGGTVLRAESPVRPHAAARSVKLSRIHQPHPASVTNVTCYARTRSETSGAGVAGASIHLDLGDVFVVRRATPLYLPFLPVPGTRQRCRPQVAAALFELYMWQWHHGSA